jgi:hypothetical protein
LSEKKVFQQGEKSLPSAIEFGKIIGAIFQNSLNQLGLIDHVAAKKRRVKFSHPRAL